MLDDCKGEKFDEMLAVFSTAVLRKLVAVSESEMIWNPAMKMSTASAISASDYQIMLPLILAHQVSLSATGARRSRVHETYNQFSQLLDDKKIELAERANQQAAHGNENFQADAEGLAHEIRANWLGSEEWATALLDGGAQSSTDAFLELPFSQAWRHATESSVDGLNAGLKQDLVIDLEARVLRLRGRLRRWHEFSDSLRKERQEDGNTAGTKSPESRVVFRDHQSLTVASISKAVRQPGDRGRVLIDADRSFMSTVNEAISHVNGKSRAKARSALPDQPAKSSPSVTEPVHHEPVLSSRPYEEKPIVSSPAPDFSNITPEHLVEHTPSSTPVVRLSPDHSSEAGSEPEPEPEPVKNNTSTSSHTLAERTRKSMSLIPPLPSHEAPPRPRQRRPRSSFPVNQFETPRKSSGQSANGRSGASTPQDKLFEEDVEYASVFKSRPRVALSPISSPAVHFDPSLDENEDFDLDYDGAEYEDVDSPLPASRSRR